MLERLISNKLIQNEFVHFVGLFLLLLKMHGPKEEEEEEEEEEEGGGGGGGGSCLMSDFIKHFSPLYDKSILDSQLDDTFPLYR